MNNHRSPESYGKDEGREGENERKGIIEDI